MRVLFVSPLAGLGGSERSLLDLIVSLRQTLPAIGITLLLFENGELAQAARQHGVAVWIEPLPARLAALGESTVSGMPAHRAREFAAAAVSAPAYLARLRARVRDLAPDVIHTNGMKAHLLFGALFWRFPLVVHLRDFPGERPLTRHLLPWLGRRQRVLVVTNSHAVAADVATLAPRVPTRVVYNGIDTGYFTPKPGAPDRLAALANMPRTEDGTLHVGMLATYAWWKGQRLFIQAMARVLAAAPDLDLRAYVIGGPIYATRGSELGSTELERLVRSLRLERHVGFVPFQRDVAQVLQALDIVVHASIRPEPFGRTIVEAMASARPVVVSRAGGAAELFQEGSTGLGFRPGDVEDLARVLLRLLRDPELRRALGEAGRKHAVECFDRARLGREIASAYAELVGVNP
jgi:glycosyltransferase involved in cell wall biosynthesis